MPTSAFFKFDSVSENLPEKVFNWGTDQLVVALTSVAPIASNSVLANLTQISYTNLSSRNVTTTTSSQTAGLYKLVLADLTLTASGGSVAAFRYIVLYDDTATNDELIGWYDYGSLLTLNSGESLLIDFDQAGGAITIQ